MKSIIIKSIEYSGENYFYRNDNFKKGVNIVLGENKHGKTTFTYLIMYALGISVPAFTDEKSQTLDEVFNDSNNSVIMTVQIDDNIYTFKRKIKENVIRIINNNEVSVLPIDRKNILFNKLNKTFSDWLLEKLNIGLIKVENIFSSEHYLNFDDLFRFSYYDQETNKNQMISDFGTGRNLLKKSPQMKKFIFETLLSYSNHQYYSKQRQVKELEKLLKEKKDELDIKYKLHKLISKENQEIYIDEDDILDKISNLEANKKTIINYSTMIDGKQSYINHLNDRLEEIQSRLIEEKKNNSKIKLEMTNAKRINKIEKKEIKSLEMLSTMPILCGNIEEECPLCGHKISNNFEDENLKIYHFQYSKEDYIDILKSRIASNKTTEIVIDNLKGEIEENNRLIQVKETEINCITQKIKDITLEIKDSNIEKSITEINQEIDSLTDKYLKYKEINKEEKNIEILIEEIQKLTETLDTNRKALKKLEFEKYDTLQIHINRFEEIFNDYLVNYFKSVGEKFDYNMFLNKDYIPTSGKYQAHSTMTEIKVFFYLTLLKYSIENSNINYPKLLIIDTIKDHGLDNKRLEKILEKVFEFNNMECQIIMTCGYEEFSNFIDENRKLIIEEIEDSKLLQKN
ncbi:hypothetical protein FDB53_13975 [Clostridium botulinum]|nr:hypothetical protein [Clostridium botulinum]NFN46303.1 hypothetical protein [Clostridium botulinum]NFR13655.1 hypothetical protein [Clostridium botulinum]NFR44444.1 hypothetical protein [Clostridium botulinum]